jgi:hypothetical protein
LFAGLEPNGSLSSHPFTSFTVEGNAGRSYSFELFVFSR